MYIYSRLRGESDIEITKRESSETHAIKVNYVHRAESEARKLCPVLPHSDSLMISTERNTPHRGIKRERSPSRAPRIGL